MNDSEVIAAALHTLASSSFPKPTRVSFLLTDEMQKQFSVYCSSLYSHNQNVNLVADASPDVVVLKHILDSLSLVEYIQPLIDQRNTTDKKLQLRALDIGSGAGFPGMALAIAFPQINFVLVDSVGKKTAFLQELVEALSLGDRVTVVNDRMEELAHDKRYRGSFDFSTNRAFGHLSLIAELSLPCLKKGGRVFCQKTSAQAKTEIDQANDLIRSLGGGKPVVHFPELKEPDTDRCVVAIEKVEPTKAKYPRPWATMKRELKP